MTDFNVGEFRCHVELVEGYSVFLAWGCRVVAGELTPEMMEDRQSVPLYLETFFKMGETEEDAVRQLREDLHKRMH